MKALQKMEISASRRGTFIIAVLLGSLSAIAPLSIDMYLPALPSLAKALDASPSLSQLSLTTCMIGIALGQLIIGPISDVRGRRMPLLIGLFIYAAASLCCVFAPNVWLFIALRFLQGFAGAAGIVISRASVRDLYSGVELTKFLALLMLVNGAAPILAPIIGAEVLVYTSWRGVFAVLCGTGLLLLAAIWFGLKESLPEERRSRGGMRNTLLIFRRLLTDSAFMGYALTQGLIMAAMFAYISGSSFVVQDIYGVTPRGFSLIFAMNGAGIIAASQLTGRLAGRFSARGMLGAGLCLSSTGAALLLFAVWAGWGLTFVCIAFFLLVSSVGIVSTTTVSLALQEQGQSAGSASALLGLLSFVFGGIAAPLVGLGGEGTALPLALVISLFVLAALVVFFALTGRKAKNA
ncbi:multidrug effflux MFS transporter [Paenibacillus sp. HB172176]|uniref:multidrug effflux MFS transporter n=1 Tax=Paenibacillus sp. HB172176 TaxID=2493690 RepID=UPI001F0D4C39|nr:multidrug effflux MFS transporter [Paenibacillus sp. HB172176]